MHAKSDASLVVFIQILPGATFRMLQELSGSLVYSFACLFSVHRF